MRILVVHNFYQIPGGEDQVFHAEADLLENHGHQVYRYTTHNNQIGAISPLKMASKTLWNSDVYQEVRAIIRRERIQIAHFHNIFPLISPSAYYAAQVEGVPVIQTLHNYRLLCPSAVFYREGQVCEACLGKFVPLPGIINSCYRGSQSASAVVAAMLTLHRTRQTWSRNVNTYIALTDFARQKFIQGGVAANRIVVKPNFVHSEPGVGKGSGGYALFAGRLSPEKGIGRLLNVWKQLGGKIPLKIVGDGPLNAQVAEAVRQIPGVEWLGRQPLEEVYACLQEAAFLVFPSEWYEGLPRILIEAFAVGTPVIAPDLGSMSSLIRPHQTGLHFQPGNSQSLLAQVEWALAHPEALAQMRQEARAMFESSYSSEKNYSQLIHIYQQTLGQSVAA